MIKGIYSLKSLKLCLFGLLISSIMVVGNFLSSHYITVGGGSYDSAIDNNFSITPIKGGNFLSSFLGQAKGLLAVDEYDLFWWSSRGVPYVSLSGYVQGYYSSYWLCDELTSTDQSPTNCIQYNLNPGYKDNLKSFFNSLQDGDLIYYDFLRRYDAYYPQFKADVCWSSSSINKSLCFRYNYDKRAQGCVGCYGELVDSEGFQGLTFFNINSNVLSYAPGQGMYQNQGEINGGSSDVSNTVLTGDVMTRECTKSWAKGWYEFNGYSKRLCYGGLNDFSTTTGVLPIAGQGLDVEEIRFNTNDLRAYGQTGSAMDYAEWFTYWRDVYEIYKKNRDTVSNPFVGVPTVILTYFGFVDSYGLAYTNSTILEYCDLAIYTANYDVPYEGINQGTICSSSLVSLVDQSISQQVGTGPIVGSSWEGITDRTQYIGDGIPGQGTGQNSGSSSGVDSYQDGVSFQNGFFGLLKDSFKYPTGSGTGAIPSYIIITMIGLMLFRFIKK